MKFDIALLQGILDEAVASGEECGLQLAVYDRGVPAVELCAGFADRARRRPVTPETLFPVFSCGKGIMAAAFHMLVERGRIRYSDRIADYWPEYGCNGKEETLVWHALTHRAAVNYLPHLDSPADMGNWELMCRKLAAAVPVNAPGGPCAYHGVTFAWLVGETASRAGGVFFGDFIRREIFERLGIGKDFFFGTGPEEDARMAEVDGPEDNWCRTFIGEPAIRHGFVPSANGVGTAGALAKIYAAVAFGVEGQRLLTPETVANATILRRAPNNPVKEGEWAKFGLGWALPHAPENEAVFGHGGALGGEAFVDLERGLAVGFVKNHVTATHPVHPVRNRISEALGLKCRRW